MCNVNTYTLFIIVFLCLFHQLLWNAKLLHHCIQVYTWRNMGGETKCLSNSTKALKWGVSFVLTTSYFTVASFYVYSTEKHMLLEIWIHLQNNVNKVHSFSSLQDWRTLQLRKRINGRLFHHNLHSHFLPQPMNSRTLSMSSTS